MNNIKKILMVRNPKVFTILLLLWLRDWVASLIDETLCPHDLESVVNGVQLRSRCTVRVEVVVTPSEVLSIVDGEVHVMQRVVSRAVDEFLGPVSRDHVAIVDEDGPDLYGDEENHVQVTVHWADEDKGAGHVSTKGKWGHE